MFGLLHELIDIGDDNVFHSEWEYPNKIKIKITGSNVVNIAAGIILQERKQGATPRTDRKEPQVKSNKRRSREIDSPAFLAPVTLYTRVEPKLAKSITSTISSARKIVSI